MIIRLLVVGFCSKGTCPQLYNQSRPVADQLELKPVKTGLETTENRRRPVSIGSVWFSVISEFGETSLGPGLAKFGLKTGPDLKALSLSHLVTLTSCQWLVVTMPDSSKMH